MLDSKQYSVRNYQKTVEDYADYIELAEAAGVPDVMGQIIPEIYNQAMFAGTALLYDFLDIFIPYGRNILQKN